MNAVMSESEVLRSFREIDRAEVELSPDLVFPLVVEEAVAWAVGPRAFLVFRDKPEAPPRGIVFHRNSGAMPDVVAMCEWCHAVRGHGRVKLLSVQTGDRRRIGLYLCSDLSCVVRTRETPGIDDVPERLDRPERTRRTLRRIADFAARRVF
jgi:FBP C-terminal treble-clef zinc-finger